MPSKTLRVVDPSEPPPQPPKVKSISEAAESGTTREVLVAMRARIASAVQDANTPARDLAALTKRLIEVIRDIEAIDARAAESETEGSLVEDGDFDASAV